MDCDQTLYFLQFLKHPHDKLQEFGFIWLIEKLKINASYQINSIDFDSHKRKLEIRLLHIIQFIKIIIQKV